MLVARIRPLAEITDRESLMYALAKRLHFSRMRCPFATEAASPKMKRWLNQIEDWRPGFKISFLRFFLKELRPRLPEQGREPLRACARCGAPTSREVCSFCRLLDLVRAGSPCKE